MAGRYAEAADNYDQLDKVFEKRDLDLSLDNIGTYLLPKMHANILAGRNDFALAVGMKIIACYDSALTKQKQDATAELAIIYDTQGKERKIAEQQMRLSRARLLALAVSIIALTVEMESNAPIGLWPELEYVGESIDDFKDRLLFMYTDGLNEAEDRQQHQFGEDRIIEVLTSQSSKKCQDIVAAMNAHAERFRAGAEPNDDLTMMCIRYV